ncbi:MULTISPECIES: siderophore ABC transporter substrate-binding protein [unclassified Corynebacterium]|uniref:siderophore ABC transporter substrate-binding protein n=1 Tax=unclassified Corynebacterium TaxID=2624378 RepID=UPI0029CA7C9A|nr:MULTISPECIES: ABC transporter substrate-binding protein [unclassified Corynebacterium]WPF66723.1 ABC transporter substrate-binding protein [Corynebacterium sp. 22KM0430]WPF69211.1 ABC transporter substrate-binding protein [Corynebacterium sp. 21KM1197]
MIKKRSALAAIVAAASLALVSCSSGGGEQGTSQASDATTVSVEDNHGTQEVSVPASKVAATDNRSFELLDKWDVDLVAAPKPLIPFTVTNYANDDSIVDLGSHREPNLEALAAAQPDLVINGQRFTQYYEDIVSLNPEATVVELEPREDKPLADELKRHTLALGELFAKNKEAQETVEAFDAALARAKKAYDGSATVMAVNVTGGEINYIAPITGRTFGPIFEMLNLKPALEVENASEDHRGDDIGVEAIAEANPDWFFVLDRDGAVSARTEPGFVKAQQIVQDNAVLSNLAAVKDKHVYYAPQDTYTNESILTYTEILNGIADAFESGAGNDETA